MSWKSTQLKQRAISTQQRRRLISLKEVKKEGNWNIEFYRFKNQKRMSYLENSTHFNNWVFTEEELARIHRLRLLKTKHALRLEHEQMLAAGANGSSILRPPRKPRSFAALVPKSTTAVLDVGDWNDQVDFDDLTDEEDKEEKANLQITPLLEFLTPEQEKTLREFYEIKIQESCSQLFRTSDKVKCSAVMLYKRFYLSNSVMEFHPKYIVPTAIYVAGKVEEQYISVDTIAEQLHVDHKFIIGHEMILLEGVRFQLIMYHPFRALLGFVDDFRAFTKTKGQDLQLHLLQKLHSNSCVVVNDLLLTELPLTHFPAYLALAALCQVADDIGTSSADPMLKKADVLEYIRRSKFSQDKQVDAVISTVEKVNSVYQQYKQTQLAAKNDPAKAEHQAKQMKSLYKKLKKFHEEEKKSSNKEKSKDEKKRKKDNDGGKKDEKKKAKKHKKDKKDKK